MIPSVAPNAIKCLPFEEVALPDLTTAPTLQSQVRSAQPPREIGIPLLRYRNGKKTSMEHDDSNIRLLLLCSNANLARNSPPTHEMSPGEENSSLQRCERWLTLGTNDISRAATGSTSLFCMKLHSPKIGLLHRCTVK